MNVKSRKLAFLLLLLLLLDSTVIQYHLLLLYSQSQPQSQHQQHQQQQQQFLRHGSCPDFAFLSTQKSTLSISLFSSLTLTLLWAKQEQTLARLAKVCERLEAFDGGSPATKVPYLHSLSNPVAFLFNFLLTSPSLPLPPPAAAAAAL